ncbi:hypothetical protein FO519_003663 [Halicephalobus sp. NKZ332]|nr:hypothetical protein FO519_003663 [Halicephalobus sp. NKZ332]
MTGDIPHSIAPGPPNYLLIGFSNGVIRAIHTETFEVIHLVGKPHFLYHDISSASDFPEFYQSIAKASSVEVPFPDWSLSTDFRQSLINGYRNHVGAIMDLEMIPVNFPWLSGGTFVTSGVDATIRFWNFEKQDISNPILTSNILSPELKKILFITDDVKLFKDTSDNNGGMIFNDGLDSSTGAKCLKLKYDGTQLAAGFKDGNLGVFDITTAEFKKIAWIEAHDGEILCAEYSDPRGYNSICILATGGRDRLIHLFDADNNYAHIQSVEDHSSSVNSIKFVANPVGFEMFTCGTDKLVVIRRLTISEGAVSLERRNQFNSPSGLNYLTTGPDDTLLFACQDRQVRTYTVNGKMIKQVKGTLCEEGTLTKLTLDPSGTYAATVCSDRYVYLIDIATGECAAMLNGQSDSVTAIAFTPDCRCTTPDSVIESGSDSASLIGKKERPGLNASGSEFGSLTSVAIGNDDDLDSGVGGASRHPVIDFEAKDSNHFEIRRVPQEVVRRSSSSYLNTPDFDSERASPQLDQENSGMLSSHQQPNSYISSRSMSSLHRSNASPQRIRRKWNDINPSPSPSPVNPLDYSNSQTNHVYQQPIQQISNSGLSTSVSLHGLRNYSNYESPVATSTPKNSFAPVPHRAGFDYRNQNQFEDSFDRSNSSRNSLTKKFMNLGGSNSSSSEIKAVWTPPKYDSNRRPSGLFNNSLHGSQGIHRRQSERPIPVSTNMSNEDSGTANSRRLFQTRIDPNNSENPDFQKPQLTSISIQMRTKKVDRKTRGRMTMSDCYDLRAVPGVSSPLSPGSGLKVLQEEDYESSNLHLKSRSQSPSSLMLNIENENSRSRQNLRNPSDMGTRITPSGSRSNLRSLSTTLNKSSQALNKMLEAREKLKKSQENLSIQIGEEVGSPSGSNAMARSRSIGNLRFSASRGPDGLGYTGFEEGLSDSKRQIARSVTSLHNEEDNFQHPDEVTLQNQYAGGSRRQSNSRLADSIRNLQKLSNPDLTNESLYQDPQMGFNLNESTSSSSNAPPGAYYTLPKNLRNKGPVSKRVHKVTAVRIDQTSESDSNASDQTPNGGFNGSFIKVTGSSGSTGFMRQNGPSRSSSSVEPGRVSSVRRAFEPIRKPTNYLAQKISQQDRLDFSGPDNGMDEASPRSNSSSEVPISVRHRVKFTERPPQVVRYSYHAGDLDASTSLFFAKLQQVMEMDPLSSDPPGNFEKLRSPDPLGNLENLRNLRDLNSLSSFENRRNSVALGNSRDSDPLNLRSPRESDPLRNSKSPIPIGASVTLRSSNPVRNQSNPRLNPHRHSSYEPTYANIIPKSQALGHHYDNVPVKDSDFNKRHKWSENYGVDTVDVIQKPSGITRVMIGESDDDEQEMAMHLYECIEQFNTACDKLLGARQLIDTDNALSSLDRDKLLRLVNKSITQGRSRLEGTDSPRTVSSITGGSMTSVSSKVRSVSPEQKIQIDNNFMNTYGPQIMQLLQQNMAKQN